MITIIHGDNIAESRNYLYTIKAKPDQTVLQAYEINLTDLAQLFEGSSLFFEKKSVIIEDYLSKTKKSKEKDATLSFLSKHADSHEITFWDGKLLTKSQYTGLTNPIEKQFKLPQSLFQFLDSISPNNSRTLLSLFHKTLKTTEPELLFFMIVRHVRILLAVSDNNSSIEELKRVQPWQLPKYKKQASLFSQQSLLLMHDALFEIEKKQKTGKLPTNLSTSIDFFLLSL